MFTSTFTFAKREYDTEFHALDEAIALAARAAPGGLRGPAPGMAQT